MRYIKTFEHFSIKDHTPEYIKKLLTKGVDFASEVWDVAKREGKETKICAEIISRMMKNEPITENEKRFLKSQAMDFVKILPIIAIQGIPIPIPITPFLIILGRKYGFDILPKDNSWILRGEEDPYKIKNIKPKTKPIRALKKSIKRTETKKPIPKTRMKKFKKL